MVRASSQPRWVLVSLIAAPILIAAIFVAAPASVLTTGRLCALRWRVFLSGSVFNSSTLIGGPLGEEPGWRGFALPRLQSLFGPAKASILLGSLWATWHLPLFLCGSWNSGGFPNFLLILTGFSLSMTFLFNLSRGSVVTAIAAHAFFNTVSRWLGGLLGDATIRDKPSPELILGLSGWVMACLLLAVTRGRLAYWTMEKRACELV
jgi:membrane protease YdiL (CAAX protease family)